MKMTSIFSVLMMFGIMASDVSHAQKKAYRVANTNTITSTNTVTNTKTETSSQNNKFKCEAFCGKDDVPACISQGKNMDDALIGIEMKLYEHQCAGTSSGQAAKLSKITNPSDCVKAQGVFDSSKAPSCRVSPDWGKKERQCSTLELIEHPKTGCTDLKSGYRYSYSESNRLVAYEEKLQMEKSLKTLAVNCKVYCPGQKVAACSANGTMTDMKGSLYKNLKPSVESGACKTVFNPNDKAQKLAAITDPFKCTKQQGCFDSSKSPACQVCAFGNTKLAELSAIKNPRDCVKAQGYFDSTKNPPCGVAPDWGKPYENVSCNSWKDAANDPRSGCYDGFGVKQFTLSDMEMLIDMLQPKIAPSKAGAVEGKTDRSSFAH